MAAYFRASPLVIRIPATTLDGAVLGSRDDEPSCHLVLARLGLLNAELVKRGEYAGAPDHVRFRATPAFAQHSRDSTADGSRFHVLTLGTVRPAAVKQAADNAQLNQLGLGVVTFEPVLADPPAWLDRARLAPTIAAWKQGGCEADVVDRLSVSHANMGTGSVTPTEIPLISVFKGYSHKIALTQGPDGRWLVDREALYQQEQQQGRQQAQGG